MSCFLFYDVKGIQSFIFKIPKLKYIIGGSALIDQFDKKTVVELAGNGVELIFSGGGKGAYYCDSEDSANNLQENIIEAARTIGLDIRFGRDKDFSRATQNADTTFSYVPDWNEGYPCSTSGLYPVKGKEEEHKVVRARLYNSENKQFRYFEKRLISKVLIPGIENENLDFFHNVNCDDEDGKAGAKALGNRNRWAVISMDGNDMGMQFRHQVDKGLSSEEMKDWIKQMSVALDTCSNEAASAGIQKVVSEWAGSEGKEEILDGGKITLPIRPLLVGGDDIVVLCHCSYAMDFVEEAIKVFNETSKILNNKPDIELWPATGSEITISAGVLYAPVTLPLHTAIPYSEMLLASAKGKGRDIIKAKESTNKRTPACIDWEQITDSVVDTPAAKRQREMFFEDEALNSCEVKLTRRPYTLKSFKDVAELAENYSKIPNTVRHRVLPALQKGYAERLAFYAEIKKNQTELYQDICEWEDNLNESRWESDGNTRTINVIDALQLLEEKSRMEKETV